MTVQFWFEFGSTYSYPAAMRVADVAAAADVDLEWRPFLLGPIFSASGWRDSPFNIYPAKGRYMWRDLERVCQAAAIPFTKPTTFPRNGLLAARVACANFDQPWLPEFVRLVYRANFAEDRDIAQASVVADCCNAAGGDATLALAQATEGTTKDALRRQTEAAVELGIFGAPTFVVGRELFWGNDRLTDAVAYANDVA